VTLIGSFTGQNADLGNWMWNGVKLAVDEANAGGGVNGRKIDLIKYDDQGQPTIATDLTQRAISEKTVMIYGANLSTLSLAMIPIITAAKIHKSRQDRLQPCSSRTRLTSSSTARRVSSSTRRSRSTSEHDEDQFHRDDLEQRDLRKGRARLFPRRAHQGGVTPTADKVIAPDVKDFTAVLTEIRGTNPKVLFIGAEEVQSGLIAKQARSLGISATFVGAAPIGTPTFVQTAGVDVAEGSVMTSPYLSN
jgi:branched-chain amino acid transport system substrate-binding protein